MNFYVISLEQQVEYKFVLTIFVEHHWHVLTFLCLNPFKHILFSTLSRSIKYIWIKKFLFQVFICDGVNLSDVKSDVTQLSDVFYTRAEKEWLSTNAWAEPAFTKLSVKPFVFEAWIRVPPRLEQVFPNPTLRILVVSDIVLMSFSAVSRCLRWIVTESKWRGKLCCDPTGVY